MSTFTRNAHKLTLNSSLVVEGGFREAQLGALQAFAAHVSSSSVASQLILPTGVGKSVIAAASPFVFGARRVLVVVPGKMIAGQMKAAFQDIPRLAKWGLLPSNTRRPRVEILEHLATEETWTGLAWSAEVLIGTPKVLSPVLKGVTAFPRDFFDLVIYDEAHHLPASTWDGIYANSAGRSILLTATPFRNDRKRLPGEIAFNYPLSRAISRGVFHPVSYVPVDEIDGRDFDITLARAAIERLRSTEHNAANSRILVRTDTHDHSDELLEVYEVLGGALGSLDSRTSWDQAQEIRSKVEDGSLDGFVCVGSITEGFDFPSLKIAAYHRPHKTLGPTIQFIGRLSRSGEIDGELLANRAAINDETNVLYRGDRAWRDLLPDIVDSAIDREREIREFIGGAQVRGPLDLPPLALTPSRMAHVFRTNEEPDFSTSLAEIAGSEVVQQFIHEPTKSVAYVTRRNERPRFLKIDTLDSYVYELHLVTWVEEHEALFVSTNSDPGLQDILVQITSSYNRPLKSLELRRLLSGANLERCFSVGTRAIQPMARTSYRTNSGSKTENDISPSDGLGWELGHAMGRSGDGTFGFSVKKSKIWEPGAADSLFGYRQWCEKHAAELSKTGPAPTGALDALSISETFDSFPDHPLVALWPIELLLDGYDLVVQGTIVRPERVELIPQGRSSTSLLVLEIQVDGNSSGQLEQNLDGTITSHSSLLLRRGTESLQAVDYLQTHPLTIYFAGGGMVRGQRASAPPPSFSPVSQEILSPRRWEDTEITKEFTAPSRGLKNVSTTASEMLAAKADFVIQDHLRGEIADFVGVSDTDFGPLVQLVHCKSSSASDTAARLGDIEELVPQMLRSTLHLVNDDNLWVELPRRLNERSSTSLVKGDRQEFETLMTAWSSDLPASHWQLWGVQPGISAAALNSSRGTSPGVNTLLNIVHSWSISQMVEFRFICSD